MHQLEIILILLGISAALELVARRVGIPRPVLLVLGGLGLALVPGLPRVSLDPDTVFLVFIPPLLYRASITTSLRDFKNQLRPILFLAVGLVLATIVAVAWMAHRLTPEFTWPAAFVLGAIVSPPDAVAAVAVMRRLGVPHRLVTLLEGEGLVNDAGALVAYRMAAGAAVAAGMDITFTGAALSFVGAAAGGVAIGLGAGWIVAQIRRRIGGQSLVENTLSILTPFIAFIPAEQAHTSGVLAVVATGLYLGRLGPKIVSPATRLQAQAMWDMIVFLLEGLSFVLIGLYLPVSAEALRSHSWGELARDAGWISAIIIGLRLLWMLAAVTLPRLAALAIGLKLPCPPWKESLFVGWAGMRGGDSLVIALAVPAMTAAGLPFPARDLIVFITFFVILVTLVVQGLTFAPVVRFLGLHEDGEEDREEMLARRASMEAGLAYLEEASRDGRSAPEHVEDLRDRHARRLHHWLSKEETLFPSKRKGLRAYRNLRRDMLEAERKALIRLRDEGKISDAVMNAVQRDMDFEAMLLDAEESRQSPGREEEET